MAVNIKDFYVLSWMDATLSEKKKRQITECAIYNRPVNFVKFKIRNSNIIFGFWLHSNLYKHGLEGCPPNSKEKPSLRREGRRGGYGRGEGYKILQLFL